MKVVKLIFIILVVSVVLIGGFGVHPTCTAKCDTRPEYWYNMPVVGTRYTTAYSVTVDGKPLPPVK